jgi:hypothetical protein
VVSSSEDARPTGSPVSYTLAASSPLVDPIPPGTNGCGTTEIDDLLGAPRPVDGNGDLSAACDIGPIERPPDGTA